MSKLKPQLIITGSNKKKSSFAGGIGYFLLLAIVFVLGVYVGMRLDSSDLDGDMFSRDLQSDVPQAQSVSGESETVTGVAQEEESNAYVQDVFPKSVSETNPDKIEDANLAIDPLDQTTELVDNTSTPGSLDTSAEAEKNESTLTEGDLTETDLSIGDSYRLQVAAFGNLDDANELVGELKLRGYDAYIVTTPNSRGEVWNLIKVGNFKTAQEAWDFSTMYQDKEGGEVFVENLSRGRVYHEPLEENSTQ